MVKVWLGAGWFFIQPCAHNMASIVAPSFRDIRAHDEPSKQDHARKTNSRPPRFNKNTRTRRGRLRRNGKLELEIPKRHSACTQKQDSTPLLTTAHIFV